MSDFNDDDFNFDDFGDSPATPSQASPNMQHSSSAPDEFQSAPSPSLDVTSSFPQAAVDKKIVNLTGDIPVTLSAVLGKKNINVKDLVTLRMGEVIELNRLPHEAIDLEVNGKIVGKGELVEIDGRLGIRILKIFH